MNEVFIKNSQTAVVTIVRNRSVSRSADPSYCGIVSKQLLHLSSNFFTTYRPIILVTEVPMVTPVNGVKYRRDGKNWRIRQMSPIISKTVPDSTVDTIGHWYISHRYPIERCHFRWLWVITLKGGTRQARFFGGAPYIRPCVLTNSSEQIQHLEEGCVSMGRSVPNPRVLKFYGTPRWLSFDPEWPNLVW